MLRIPLEYLAGMCYDVVKFRGNVHTGSQSSLSYKLLQRQGADHGQASEGLLIPVFDLDLLTHRYTDREQSGESNILENIMVRPCSVQVEV